MKEKPEVFIKKVLMLAMYASFALTLFFFFILSKTEVTLLILIPIFIITFFLTFSYILKFPQGKAKQMQREIDKEILFAGRFLMIEVQSGVPIFNALEAVAKSFRRIGTYFQEIVDKVEFGIPLEDAINETLEFTPSEKFRKLLWQVVNSLKTGANLSKSLETVLTQISKEQVIEVKRYGHQLNPIAMFYMIMAVIVPSLGMTMLVVLSSFLSFKLSLPILLFFVMMLGFVQFMFISIVKFSRPAVEV